VVCVFARKIDGNLTSLVKQIDEQVGKNTDKKLSAFVVFLTDDADAIKPQIEKLAEKEKIARAPLTIGEVSAGPPEYKIAKDAEVTVLFWKDQTVVANHAFKAGEMKTKEVSAVVADVAKVLK